jgi:hypothetical protein
MTDILQRYGIKEVADVTFYEIDDNGDPGAPVLVLDSLKVTSIEQTAESTEARGGKGNAKLIVWDFGKEITITIEDALFSPKSLSIMMADGKVTNTTTGATIRKSARVVCKEDDKTPDIVIDGKKVDQNEVANTEIVWYKAASGTAEMTKMTDTAFTKGDVYVAVWHHPVKQASTITITPDSFPGTYYVTGDTMVRSERTGKDEYFQFIIAKAKMQAEQTISLEAEGDPTTFNMSLQVLRPESGEMMQFIKYEFYNDESSDENDHSEAGDGWVGSTSVTETSVYTVTFYDKDGKFVESTRALAGATIDAPDVSDEETYAWKTATGQAFNSTLTDNVVYYEKPISAL